MLKLNAFVNIINKYNLTVNANIYYGIYIASNDDNDFCENIQNYHKLNDEQIDGCDEDWLDFVDELYNTL